MTTDREELLELIESLCDGVITSAQHERLQQRLAAEAAARQIYFDYLDLRLHLRQWQQTSAAAPPSGIDAPAAAPAPIVIQTLPPLHAPVSAIYAPMGSFAFSYLVAAVVVGVGLMIGWAYQVPSPRIERRDVADVVPPPPPKNLQIDPDMIFVGRVTGMVDCQWADPKTATVPYAHVALGRKYALSSGLLRITYSTGARVILQGPCVFEVESASSGLLSVGRLTAKIERKSEKREPENGSLPGAKPVCFTVRTPTAKITDLGTEFGVEVERSGISRAHVFEGNVEMRATGAASGVISLRANESAQIAVGKNGVVSLARYVGRQSQLVREMPKAVPIRLFNTGVGLKELDCDPRWQIIARSDASKFKPRPARVRVAGGGALENDPARSQWISLVGEEVDLPEDVTYTFRTTFDLTGMLPSTAVLRGKCIADDRVTAIRLNGRHLTVPPQADGEPFIYWTEFHATRGFVKGVNVLEVDVQNAGPFTPPSQRRLSKSRMSCRIELEGEVCRDPGLGGDDPAAKASRTPLRETDKEKPPAKPAKTKTNGDSRRLSTDDTKNAKAKLPRSS